MCVVAHVGVGKQDFEDEKAAELVYIQYQLLEEGNQNLKSRLSRCRFEE